MTTTNVFKFATLIAAVLLLALITVFITQSNNALGSTIQGQEYIATTTGSNVSTYGQTIGATDAFLTGTSSARSGSLASIIITGANTGVFNIYDATTTDVNARTGNKATSTILLATIPASLAAGTYTFDAQYGQGLLFDYVSGLTPTTTITYR